MGSPSSPPSKLATTPSQVEPRASEAGGAIGASRWFWLGELTPAVLALLCCLPAILPLFQPGFPETHDGRNHLLHLAGLHLGRSQGFDLARWSPLLDLGYGSPIYSYYAPLPYYGALLFGRLGYDVTDSLKCFFAFCILLCALSTYLLGRELGGRATGFVAGISVATMPYLLHDIYVRGALGEVFALAMLPLTLYAFTRFAHVGRHMWLGFAALTIGAHALSHNVSTLIYGPIFVLWIALLATSRGGSRRARLLLAIKLLLAVALGLGVAAFFWFPAIVETGLVHLDRATGSFDYHGYFNTVWPPFQPSPLVDYRYDPKEIPVRPGLAQILIAVIGLAALLLAALRGKTKQSVLWLTALVPVAVFLLFMQRVSSAFVWEHIPLAAYIQFPYRLMGPFGLITAIFAGFAPWLATSWLVRAQLSLATVAIVLVTSLAQLNPTPTSGLPPQLDSRGLFDAEVASGNLAFTADSEYVPRTVTSAVADVIRSATMVTAEPAPASGAPLQVSVVRDDGSMTDIVTMSSQPSTLILRRFFMPQWEASAGGQRLTTHAVGPLGLLAIDVPAGSQTIHIGYGRTAVENAAPALSAASVVALLALSFWPSSRPEKAPKIRLAGAIAALCVLCGPAACDGLPRSSMLSTPPPISRVSSLVELAPGYLLAGTRIDSTPAAAAGFVRVTLYLLAQHQGTDLLLRLRALDDSGKAVTDIVERPWNGPTSEWKPNELAPALVDLPLPGSMAPRTLRLSVTAYDATNPAVELGTVKLADTAIAATPVRPYHSVWANFGNTMAIRGYQIDHPEAADGIRMRPGQSVSITLDLLSLRVMGSGDNQTAFVHMLDPQGKLETQHDELAGGASHPTSRWVGGEPVRQTFAMTLPPEAPVGTYHFEAGFYQLATLQRLSLLDVKGRPMSDSFVFGNIVVANAP